MKAWPGWFDRCVGCVCTWVGYLCANTTASKMIKIWVKIWLLPVDINQENIWYPFLYENAREL